MFLTPRGKEVCEEEGRAGDSRKGAEMRQGKVGEVGEGARGGGGGRQSEQGWDCEGAECVGEALGGVLVSHAVLGRITGNIVWKGRLVEHRTVSRPTEIDPTNLSVETVRGAMVPNEGSQMAR